LLAYAPAEERAQFEAEFLSALARAARRHDESSIPFAFGTHEEFIFYAVVDEPRRVVILLRLTFAASQ
jgi:hypothetical protein